jgi:lipopolysaccharide transport system permease protein
MMSLGLLIELVRRDFTERYVGSVLGLWWSFLWPLVNIFIYTVIFSQVMGAKIKGISSSYSYGLYLASGLIPWTAFSSSILRISNIFLEKRHIITKVPIPLLILPLVVVLSETITFVISMSFFVIVLIFLGIKPTDLFCLTIVAYVFQQIFAYALGLFFAVLNVFIRDIKEVVSILIQIWFWFTPIVYVLDILPEKVKDFVNANPAYAFIQIYQKVLVTRETINFNTFFLAALISLIVLVISILVFKKLEKDIRDFL